MTKKKLTQMEALATILKRGKRTMEELVDLVAEKTGRTVVAMSLTVGMSNLRATGVNIRTIRGNPTQYYIPRG